MSKKFDNIFGVLLKILTVFKHKGKHIKQNNSIFSTVSELLLSKYRNHKRNVI